MPITVIMILRMVSFLERIYCLLYFQEMHFLFLFLFSLRIYNNQKHSEKTSFCIQSSQYYALNYWPSRRPTRTNQQRPSTFPSFDWLLFSLEPTNHRRPTGAKWATHWRPLLHGTRERRPAARKLPSAYSQILISLSSLWLFFILCFYFLFSPVLEVQYCH